MTEKDFETLAFCQDTAAACKRDSNIRPPRDPQNALRWLEAYLREGGDKRMTAPKGGAA